MTGPFLKPRFISLRKPKPTGAGHSFRDYKFDKVLPAVVKRTGSSIFSHPKILCWEDLLEVDDDHLQVGVSVLLLRLVHFEKTAVVFPVLMRRTLY